MKAEGQQQRYNNLMESLFTHYQANCRFPFLSITFCYELGGKPFNPRNQKDKDYVLSIIMAHICVLRISDFWYNI